MILRKGSKKQRKQIRKRKGKENAKRQEFETIVIAQKERLAFVGGSEWKKSLENE